MSGVAKPAKRALVTGGSGGIGAAISSALAASGLHVIVHCNAQVDIAESLADELRAGGASAEPRDEAVNDCLR